jgi:hypothetical protein
MDSSATPWPISLADLLPLVKQLPAVDKLRLIRILADELDAGEDISPFEPGKSYYLATPYNTPGAGQVLADALAASNDDSTT